MLYCNFGQLLLQEKFNFIGISNRDGPDIKLAGYPAHSKSRLSGPSLILKAHHIQRLPYLQNRIRIQEKIGSTT